MQHHVPLLRLVSAVVLVLAWTGCGDQPRPAPEAADTATDTSAPTAGSDTAPEAGGTDADAAPETAIATGLEPGIAILVVPGVGYRMQDTTLDLATLDARLAAIAADNRYRDIQIRAPGRASMDQLRPLLDLAQRHGLVNVTLRTDR